MPILSACASGVPDRTWQAYLSEKHVPISTMDAVQHCHGYGCAIITPVPLTDAEWRKVRKIFAKKSKTPAAEREKIAKSTGLLEQIIGSKAHTDTDVMGTFRKTGDDQLDCVDESTNTTTYLSMLEQAGLLKFHTVLSPIGRVPLINGGNWHHQSALIRETKTGSYYVVDSWFRDNGAPADIIDLETWRAGWKPPELHDINL